MTGIFKAELILTSVVYDSWGYNTYIDPPKINGEDLYELKEDGDYLTFTMCEYIEEGDEITASSKSSTFKMVNITEVEDLSSRVIIKGTLKFEGPIRMLSIGTFNFGEIRILSNPLVDSTKYGVLPFEELQEKFWSDFERRQFLELLASGVVSPPLAV